METTENPNKTVFTDGLAKVILHGLCTAPIGQLDQEFKNEALKFAEEPRSVSEIWDYLIALKPRIEYNNDAASAFMHTLIDVEHRYQKPSGE